jgi:type II secretory pathway component PulC
VIGGLTPRRLEAGFWLLLCGGLAVGIGLQTDWGRQWQQPIAQPAEESASTLSSELTESYRLPPADAFMEIALRPIFVVTRQLPPPAPAESPLQAMKKDQFVLTGVTIVPEGKFAFLTEKAGGKSRTVTEGKELNGITVKEILLDRVILVQYGDTEVLVLRTSKAAPVAPAAKDPPSAIAPGPDRRPGADHPPVDSGGPPNGI